MFKKGDSVLVGASGGPDSTALVYVLNSLKKELKITLRLAHLNHLLRRTESYRDMEFVKKTAKKLNIPIDLKIVNISKLANKGSVEEFSRKERHKFFREIVRKCSIKKIALGHNQDDQAETVLMRLIRGSGLYGLQGIVPNRLLEGLTFVRPLLEVSRSDINSYLKRIKVKPCTDSSNLENTFFRNKIRNRLIPFLESGFDRNIKKHLANLAQILSLDYQYLETAAKTRLDTTVTTKTKSKVSFDLKKFLKLHIAIQRMIIRMAISHILGSTRKFDYRHWQEIEDLIRNRPIDSVVDLPKGLSVKKIKEKLVFYLRK
ncbi:MAG: tRNA lysidine(34) synthetase TilS [Candidatus Omnitrophota bacterium]